jgi:uncharacterized membrane protein YeaQ/YmgE (transglycosylase-associated protein family)
MIIGLTVIFGAVVGMTCFFVKGSGYGMRRDVVLGIVGYVLSNSVISASYLMNGFGRPNVIGLNWYSLSIGTAGAVAMVYGMALYKQAEFSYIGKIK